MDMRTARKNKGYTQSELGSLVGVTQQQIAKYESGLSTPSTRVIPKIAHALDLSPFEIWDMFYNNQPPKAAEK